MASTNFLQWNPTLANQETDTAYNADASRTGGAGVDAIFPSATANKLFYQMSTFITALANALVAKGYTTSDASLSTLQGVLANILTTADVNGNLVAVTYAPAVTFNCGTNNGFQLTLTGNVTSSIISGMAIGQEITIGILQDGVGGRTFTWPAGVTTGGTVDPTPNALSVQRFKKWLDGSIRAITPMLVT